MALRGGFKGEVLAVCAFGVVGGSFLFLVSLTLVSFTVGTGTRRRGTALLGLGTASGTAVFSVSTGNR